MLEYPSIIGFRRMPEVINETCYAFTKYDGSNLRWEWSPKKGWYKFGTRHQLFDAKTPIYGPAVEIFQDSMGETIANLIKALYGKNVERITAFTEFFGPNSFAGNHVEGDPMSLKLFDVSIFKKGFMSPKDFNKIFGADGKDRYVDTYPWVAQLEYTGPFTSEFIEDIRNDKYPVNEGVVCKGGEGHNIWRTKVKSLTYLEKLKARFPKLYEEDGDLV